MTIDIRTVRRMALPAGLPLLLTTGLLGWRVADAGGPPDTARLARTAGIRAT